VCIVYPRLSTSDDGVVDRERSNSSTRRPQGQLKGLLIGRRLERQSRATETYQGKNPGFISANRAEPSPARLDVLLSVSSVDIVCRRPPPGTGSCSSA
jgi:hypothetical protein